MSPPPESFVHLPDLSWFKSARVLTRGGGSEPCNARPADGGDHVDGPGGGRRRGGIGKPARH
eukprot:9204351-Lingulodinium_polyedra.AAC.1